MWHTRLKMCVFAHIFRSHNISYKLLISNKSNKCFIHSPAADKPKIIVFWLYWQQDFKWGFIEAGLLIKQRCTKPIRKRAGTIFLYGYCIHA